jgi:predicted nucleotidyltransferase
MRTTPPDLLPIFRTNLQAELLAALFLDDDAATPAGELVERTASPAASVYRELTRLVDAGLIERERERRGAGFRPAKGSPLYEPMRELLERTMAVEPQLTRALATIEGIDAAAIFGSWAARKPGGGSDIDLLVVGNVDRDELLAHVKKIERVAGREIDVTAYGREEYERRLGEGSGFLRTVLRGPLIELVGKVA